jgi:nitrite reductase/ring-hydroxylating ferredoxin subunit
MATEQVSVRVGDVRQIPHGSAKVIFFEQREVAIFNINGRFCALDNLCPHEKGPLSAGTVEGEVITCPVHGARFDLRTGRGLPGPHRCDVKAYAVEVKDFEVRLFRTS